MLKHLYIKNFTLIDELDIDLYKGFSVMTGETGAGKSIILGAIGLLLGQRADIKAIKQGAEKCVIEAQFDLSRYDMEDFFTENDIEYDAEETIIRRELTSAGKSRAFINDTPVQLSMLKELGERLVDVHSQHQNLLLNKQDFQMNVVDIIADDAKQLALYQKVYSEYHTAIKQLETLRDDIERNRQNLDFLQFQCDELVGANLQEGEQEELEQQSDTMAHSEDIKSALYTADNALSAEGTGVVESLRSSLSALRSIERVLPSAAEYVQRIDSTYIELKDLAQDISSQLERIDFDPAEFDAINNRLDRLYDLQKKYHVESVGELIEKRDELKRQLSNIENSDEALAELDTRCQQLKAETQKHADALTKLRSKAARSANTSTPLQPVSQVASGGEIARVMLSLKAMISGAVKLPTIIFDEIDTGVSGKIAEQMAQIMQEMGRNDRQVISITHLPQIAALGAVHYKVEKEETAQGTTSRMRQLTPDERITEIAQMLSGSDISDAAIQNAKQLLRL